jgi:hypothetical protein
VGSNSSTAAAAATSRQHLRGLVVASGAASTGDMRSAVSGERGKGVLHMATACCLFVFGGLK